MNISRRTILKSAAIGAATAIGSAVTRAPALAESDTVKVASLHDLSGAVDVYGVPSHMCMKVAIDEINAAGGLLGKKIELKVYDGQSNIKNTRAMRSRPHWKTKWSCSRAR
jgi:urea transport system substrate-binding protein